MIVRTYTRRSKNDEGKQQFSLDVQSSGCREFLAASAFAGAKVDEYVDDGKAGDDFHSRSGLRQLLAEVKSLFMCECLTREHRVRVGHAAAA
jgi:DNA invertase Pin-like site-specific DNA recombinase